LLKITATANSNIALIKYWGKRDLNLNLPAVGSISITLDGLSTTTTVCFDPTLKQDQFTLNGNDTDSATTRRVSNFLNLIRSEAKITTCAKIESRNNFPTAAGLASSASAFAALATAASWSAGLNPENKKLSEWARRGSGSAARSIFGGYVEMYKGQLTDGSDAIAEPLADKNFWDLRLVIAITSELQKETGSTHGMNLSEKSSLYYPSWVDNAESDLAEMRAALLAKDFEKVGELSEYSCLKMHALAQSGRPGIVYWNGATVEIMQTVRNLRKQGIPSYFTIDAGPQVKVLCLPENEYFVRQTIEAVPGVLRTIQTRPGDGVSVLEESQ